MPAALYRKFEGKRYSLVACKGTRGEAKKKKKQLLKEWLHVRITPLKRKKDTKYCLYVHGVRSKWLQQFG